MPEISLIITTGITKETYTFVSNVKPLAAGFNQNPTLFTNKINTLITAVNRLSYAVLTGFTGSTTRGMIYKIPSAASGALALAEPNYGSFEKCEYGFGTGNTGEVQVFGEMGDIALSTINPAFTSFPANIYLGYSGLPQPNKFMQAGYWVAMMAKARRNNLIYINPQYGTFAKNLDTLMM